MTPTVVGIYVGDAPQAPLLAQAEVVLEAGRGVVGDRYYAGTGTFSKKLEDRHDWEVTLIEMEEIQRFNDSNGVARGPGEFRRNIVTRGVRLNDLVGRRFVVGRATLDGIRLCEPCAHLAKFVGSAVVAGMAQVQSTRDAVAAAQASLAATRVGREVGNRTQTDVLNAIQTLAQAQAAHAQARHQFILGRLQLQQAAGALTQADLANVNALLQ